MNAPRPSFVISRAVPKSTGQLGFTLLELLVVMVLLSIIMLGLVSALRTMAQTETKIDQRLQRLDEIRVARTFLQQTLTRVSAAKIEAPGATGKSIIPFNVSTDSLTWIGILPARPNVGGRHFFRLTMEDTLAGRELVLRFAPWQPDIVFTDWSNTQSRVLIQGIKKISLEAHGLQPQGRKSEEPWPKGWESGWPISDTLPEQLRILLVDSQGDWPEWTMPLRALPQSDESFGSRLSFGPSK